MRESPNFSVEKLTAVDVEAAERMRAQSWLDTYVREDLGVTKDYIRTRVGAWLTEDRIQLRRATVETTDESQLLQRIAKDEQGNVIGIVVAHKDRSGQYLKALYVDKLHHGTGIATELLDTSLEWFDGVQPVRLEVASYNDRAIRFYEKHGFKQVEASDHIFGDTIPAINMIREGENE